MNQAAPNTSASAAEQRRQALGEFIRSRRERTTPEMVGMPPTLRRRTPGLRREEVALLSGIGVTWYTWLEQGRPINVSTQVLGAIARILRMDTVERAHLFTLAELTEPDVAPVAPSVDSAIQSILDQLSPYPASVAGPHWEVLAYNHSYQALVGDVSALPCKYRNTLFVYFSDPRWRRVMDDWAHNAPRLVAKMRAAMAADVADPVWQQLLDLITRHSPEFQELWERQDVASIDSMHKLLHHEVGDLDTEVVHTWLGTHRNTRLSVYTPLDEATRKRFELLADVVPQAIQIPGLEPAREAEPATEAGPATLQPAA